MSEPKVISRYSVPSKLDQLPYGTIIKVIGEEEKNNLFMQLNENQEEPHWRKIMFL